MPDAPPVTIATSPVKSVAMSFLSWTDASAALLPVVCRFLHETGALTA
jgi:hypothetical protein